MAKTNTATSKPIRAGDTANDNGHGALHPRQVRLLNRAKKTPSIVLKDRRCRKSWFCHAFLDHGLDVALRRPQESLKIALLGVELTTLFGDRHLNHRAHGVLAHSYINREERERASEVLEDYKASALACCDACASDWYLRQGDLQVESHDAEASGRALTRSLQSLGPEASADDIAYICSSRCLQQYRAGNLDQSLADIACGLRDLRLDRPRAYFLDLIAFTSCFLFDGGEIHHDERALAFLQEFRQRIKGLEGWHDVRMRYTWVEGLLHGRLGHWKRAHKRLSIASTDLAKRGPDHHALAVAIDSMMLYSRRPVDHNYRVIQRLLRACETRLQLDRPQRRLLRFTKAQVSRFPKYTPVLLDGFRRTLVVPVSGILDWALRGRRKARATLRLRGKRAS